MCILFLLVGDVESPTLICNNRDEYYNRRTKRGELSANGSHYSPLDIEGGGTWISVDGVNQSADKFRYAIVLNFHHWRERYPFTRSAPLDRKNGYHDLTKLKSRGLLIKTFMNDYTLCAEEYASRIYTDRYIYRPFNLIVSDHTGTYYVSSSVDQRCPEKLEPGRLYAISNGYLRDAWEKTTIGKKMVESCLTERSYFAYDCPVVTQQPGGVAEAMNDDGPLKPHLLTITDVQPLLHKIVKVLENDSDLADPTFGSQSVPAMQLSSIFVKPTLIIRKPILRYAYTTKHILLEMLRTLAAVGTYMMQFLTGQLPQYESRDGFLSDLLHWALLFIPRAMVLGIFILPTYANGKFTHEEDVFGTRTTTVAAYFPSLPVKSTGPTASTNDESTPTVGSRYYIVERDLDPVALKRSNHEFTNI